MKGFSEMVDFDVFKSLSKYERKVDFKKLKFIYNGIRRYLTDSSISPDALKILEVGCGDGSITMPLSAIAGSVTALDIDDRLIANLREDIKARNIDNIAISCANAYHFAIPDTFHIIITSEVLEHVDYPARIISNLKDHLTPGGYFIVTVPNGYGPWEMANRIKFKLFTEYAPYRECGHQHVQFFTVGTIIKLFSDSHLTLIDFGKSDVFSGISYRTSKTRIIADTDLVLADLLPGWMSSGWYFIFKNNKSTASSARVP